MGFSNGKVVRVVMKAHAGTDVNVNVLHYDFQDDTVTGGENSGQSLADYFRDNVKGSYAGLFSAGWTIDPVVVEQEIDPLDIHAPREAWQSGTASAGTRLPTTDNLPNAMCVLIPLKTDRRGRRYNGRMFVSGEPHEGDQVGGNWTSVWLNTVQAFVDTIPRQPDVSSGPSTSTARWSVFSRTQRLQNKDPYMTAVSSALVQPRVHWLRSRFI